MNNRALPSYLRIVESPKEKKEITAGDISRPDLQRTLFATPKSSLLIFINADTITESELTTIINERPTYVIDTRLSPHFQIGDLTRKIAFTLMSESGSKYIDAIARMGISSSSDERLTPANFGRELRKALFSDAKTVQGPLAFILDEKTTNQNMGEAIAEEMLALNESGWDILLAPPSVSPAPKNDASERDIVFICHANPEDNDFTRWLASQLTMAGYKVWADLSSLTAGETFWDTIESMIRQRAAKVIVVISSTSQKKSGVLDEINLAVMVERSLGIRDMVIPVKIDELPFSEVRANLGRKNIINFFPNWANGMSHLLNKLKSDGVQHDLERDREELADWYRSHAANNEYLSSAPEKLTTNWLRIRSFPENVYFYDFEVPNDLIDVYANTIAAPHFRYLRMVGSFSELEVIKKGLPQGVSVKEAYCIPTDKFLQGCPPELPGLRHNDAHNLVAGMAGKAWNSMAQVRGLLPYVGAAGGASWYPPKELIEGNKVSFTDPDCRKSTRTLVGWSNARQIFWHFAIEAKPVMTLPYHFLLRPHVAFTNDGVTLLGSTERMHRLRRRFCKSWWNARWRDMLLAYVQWLTLGSGQISIPIGNRSSIIVDGWPITFESEMSPILTEFDVQGAPDDLDYLDDAEGEYFEDERDIEDAIDAS